mgnify:FL=1
MENSTNKNSDIWVKSPITGAEQVLCEYDDANGASKMDLSSGFYTNEYPLNHKKNPDFDIENYQESMPKLIKDCRFDDGESYWYPSTIRTKDSMVFPVGKPGDLKWCFAEVKKLSADEKKDSNSLINYESKLDLENAKYFDRYLDAVKTVKGYSLGDFKDGEGA